MNPNIKELYLYLLKYGYQISGQDNYWVWVHNTPKKGQFHIARGFELKCKKN